MRIAFLGDISLNDDYTRLKAEGKDPFLAIGKKLESFDLVVGNLECLAAGNEGVNEKKKPRLQTDLSTLDYLYSLHVSAVTLAHNHVYDNLTDGFVRTTNFLDCQRIEYLGAGLSPGKAASPFIVEENGHRVCFLSYVHPDTNPSLPGEAPIHLNLYDKERILEEIRTYKTEGYFVILLLHWGGRFEGGLYPDRYQSRHARSFVKAGADLIIGHHSHTLQARRLYSGKQVFFSLGNFCFADIHSDGRIRPMSRRAFRESVIPVISLEENGRYSVELIPIRNQDLEIVEDPQVLKKLGRRSRMQAVMEAFPPIHFFYLAYFRVWFPIWEQLNRKDPEKSLLQRFAGLNLKKVKQLFRIK